LALGAFAITGLTDCDLHEGFATLCIVLGTVMGDIQQTLGVMGWFGPMTLPIGARALLVLLVIFLNHPVLHRRKNMGQRRAIMLLCGD